jgi:hypothetical protein
MSQDIRTFFGSKLQEVIMSEVFGAPKDATVTIAYRRAQDEAAELTLYSQNTEQDKPQTLVRFWTSGSHNWANVLTVGPLPAATKFWGHCMIERQDAHGHAYRYDAPRSSENWSDDFRQLLVGYYSSLSFDAEDVLVQYNIK